MPSAVGVQDAVTPVAVSTVHQPEQSRSRRHILSNCWVPFAAILGITVGFISTGLTSLGGKSQSSWECLSQIVGWTYFCMWSISFYPQVVQNFNRKSVVGLSVDYQTLNFVGFSLYFAFNASLFWVPAVQQEYRDAHDGKSSAVQLNDVAFAGHAALLTAVTLVQIVMYYDYPPLDRSDKTLRYCVLAAVSCVGIAMVILAAIVLASSQQSINWLSYLLFLSSVKVAISVAKYCPQVWLNYRRKSTDGWNIHNVMLDFMGGFLSCAQLVLDAWIKSDWSAITGDPAKLALGNISMVFDVIFMVQHFGLYKDASNYVDAADRSTDARSAFLTTGAAKASAGRRNEEEA